MAIFKRGKPDNRAFEAFKETLSVISRSADCMVNAGAELLKVSAHVKDPEAIKGLVQAHRELAVAAADGRACMYRVSKLLGVKDGR